MLSYTAQVSSHVEVEHLSGLQTLGGRRKVSRNEHISHIGSLRLKRLDVHAGTVRWRNLHRHTKRLKFKYKKYRLHPTEPNPILDAFWCTRQSTAWHHVISTNCASQFRLFPTFPLSVPLLVVIRSYPGQAWNSLPLDIRSAPTLSTFKNMLKTSFLTFLLH